MKLSDIYPMLTKLGKPVTYGQFSGPEEDIPDPPYFVWYETRSDNTGADNIVYAENLNIIVELYTGCRDLELEEETKKLLTANGIFFNTDHADIKEEGVHIAYFMFRVTQ